MKQEVRRKKKEERSMKPSFALARATAGRGKKQKTTECSVVFCWGF
jgi:hypothetical protein